MTETIRPKMGLKVNDWECYQEGTGEWSRRGIKYMAEKVSINTVARNIRLIRYI